MTISRKRRLLRGVALGAVFAVAGTGMATSAFAADIDQSQTGSIIIHKHENPGNGAGTPDGTGDEPTTPGIAGVVFEYCTIAGINLFDGTNTGWDALKAITPAQLAAASATGVTTLGSYNLTNCAPAPATDVNGLSTTPDLPLGPYFVREISAPSNVVAPAAPFIVALPTPQNLKDLTGEWVYDVNVYPKNTVAEGPRKNIVHQDTNGPVLGAPVDYEVTTKIPALPAGETYDKFILTDTLDTKLTPNMDPSKVIVKVFGGATFVQGTDYTFGWSGQTLTVTFLAPGLAKLQPGQNVVVGFTAAANAVGTIDNQAFVNVNDIQIGTVPPGTPPGSNPTNVVQTRWGAVELKKVNADNTGQGLTGAEFTVWMSKTDAAGCKADFANLTQVMQPGTNTPYVVTAGTGGVVTIPGLWVGDTELKIEADGTVTNTTVAGHDFQARCYVIQETKAPAGFILPTGDAALTEIVVKPGTVAQANPIVTITNKQQGVPGLPLTGSDGQMILTIGGIALIVVAAGVVVIARRRRHTLAVDES